MLTSKQLRQLKTHIQRELSGLWEWAQSPEIDGIAKQKSCGVSSAWKRRFCASSKVCSAFCGHCGQMLNLVALETDPGALFCQPGRQEQQAAPGR